MPIELLIVSGISGSGKTVVLTTLEDQGFYCLDNLPVGLISAFVSHILDSNSDYRRVAIGIDARNRPEDLGLVPSLLSQLAAIRVDTRLVFLESTDEILLKRFSETRRRHPLSNTVIAAALPLREAIAKDRALMQQIESLADIVIDTSDLNVHQLRRKVVTELGLMGAKISLLFESFAYKKGVPADADFVFDARGLPNPHWDLQLRPLSGRDLPVRDWLSASEEVQLFYQDLERFLTRWLPAQNSPERAYLTVAVGCSGGRHRSVYLVERLAAHFRNLRDGVQTFHREQGV